MAPLLSTRSVPLNDSGHAIVAINIILAFIATMTCAARFWARKLTGLNWSWDDWLALASLLVNHAFMAITVNAAFHGLGQSMTVLLETSPASIPVFLKCVLAAEMCYGISSPLIKLSLLAFYWRMFPTDHVRRCVIVLSVACLLWTLAILVTNLLECQPLSYLWDQLVDPTSGSCIDLVLYMLGNAIANSIIDILTLILPINEVFKLHMNTSKKIGVCCVFALGSIVVIASFVRLGSLADLAHIGVTDTTRQYAVMWTATVVEIYIAIIGACAVTLVPVYRKLRKGHVWSTSPSGASGYGKSTNGMHSSSNQLSSYRRPAATAAHERIYDGDSSENLGTSTGGYAWRDTKVSASQVRQEDVDGVPLTGIVVKRDLVLESRVDHHH